jgi:starvation-inducible outer membrane lipoprotein
MKLIILAVTALSLTGCATPPQWLANHFDRGDICQTREFAANGARLKPEGYQQPYGCGGTGTTTAVIRDNQGRRIGSLTSR